LTNTFSTLLQSTRKAYPDGKRHLATAPLVLYNLELDPAETQNVVDQFPKKAQAMVAQLGEVIARYESEQVRDVPAVVEDEDLRKNLEALGYVIGDPKADHDDAAADREAADESH
jgi:hypothetical protein